MSQLKEYKNKHFHYYLNYWGRRQGEYKYRRNNGQLGTHCYYKDGERHGEYKEWYSDGRLRVHCYYKDHKDITKEVIALVEDIKNITKEERMIIKLKYGIDCI